MGQGPVRVRPARMLFSVVVILTGCANLPWIGKREEHILPPPSPYELEAKQEALARGQDQLKADLNAMKADLNQVKGNLDAIRAAVQQLVAGTRQTQVQGSELEKQLAEVQAGLTELARMQKDLAELLKKSVQLEEAIGDLQVIAAALKAEVEDLKTRRRRR